MTNKAPRTGWLDKLLGKEKADEVIADTIAAADIADGAGITRKAFTPEDEEEKKPEGEAVTAPESEEAPTPHPEKEQEVVPDEEKEGDMVAEVGVKLAQQIFDVAKGNLSTLTQDQLGVVIADALRPAVEEETEPEEASSVPQAERDEEMAGKSVEIADKAIGGMIAQIAKDQGEIAHLYTVLTEDVTAVKALKPVVDDLAKAIQELKAGQERIDARLGDRPRIASQAVETLVDTDSEAGKAIATAAEKGVNQEKKFLGVPVKNIPK